MFDKLRKKPTQARARATFDAIVEATAQILVRNGVASVTTNKIAKLAGVSIGSLYQYFPNKETILTEVAYQFLESEFQLLQGRLMELDGLSADRLIREAVKVLFDSKSINPELSRVVFEQLPSNGFVDILEAWTQRTCKLIVLVLEQHRDEIGVDDLELAAYLCVNAMHGIVNYTVLYRQDLLENEAFLDEVTRMLMSTLKVSASTPQDEQRV